MRVEHVVLHERRRALESLVVARIGVVTDLDADVRSSAAAKTLRTDRTDPFRVTVSSSAMQTALSPSSREVDAPVSAAAAIDVGR